MIVFMYAKPAKLLLFPLSRLKEQLLQCTKNLLERRRGWRLNCSEKGYKCKEYIFFNFVSTTYKNSDLFLWMYIALKDSRRVALFTKKFRQILNYFSFVVGTRWQTTKKQK